MPLAYTLTGIGVYLQQLVMSIHSQSPDVQLGFATDLELPFRWLVRRLLSRNLDAAEVERVKLQLTPGFSPFGPFRKYCRRELDCSRFDLYHVTNTVVPYRRYTTPTVVTVYDLAELRSDNNSLKYESLIPAIKSAAHNICISEATQRDVVELLGVPMDRTTVTPLAPRLFFEPPTNDDKRVKCRQFLNKGVPYFLAVSTIEPRKNYVRMLQAFSQIRASGFHGDFLIAGAKRSAWPEVAMTIKKFGLEECVRVLGWVDNQRLLGLMWGCEALVYASLYEGFGLPALEAMACGTPVVCSAAGSLGEVVGDAAIIVDPLSVESIADGMEQIVSMGDGRDAISRRSIEHAARFSWKSTAAQTLAVYRNVLQR